MIYSGENLREVIFPIGGIGTGCIGLGGNGTLRDFEIFNRPNKGSFNNRTFIAVRAVKNGVCIPRVLNGDWQGSRMGDYSVKTWSSGYGFGVKGDTMSGFPHFAKTDFRGEYPYAYLNFEEGGFPAKLSLKAFNPFIPLDDLASGLPAAFFEVEFENTDAEEIKYSAAFTCKNPYDRKGRNSYAALESGAGVTLKNVTDEETELTYGDLTVGCGDKNAFVQREWYRGAWMDTVVTFWNEFSCGGPLRDRVYDEVGAEHATVMSEFTLAPGEKKSVRFVLTWNNPVCYNYWSEYKDENGKDVTWKNWYATQFENSAATAEYCLKNWDSLDGRTKAFHDALFGSTLDPVILDAVSSTMSVLKSATVMRLEDGSFYGFEGTHEHEGCCEGTCQHVWNYAYALPFLFPALQRTTIENEFKYSTDEFGDMEFRIKLPMGRPFGRFRPCVDGQMGAVLRCYREWKISGDNEWLKKIYPDMVKVLSFATSEHNRDEWDRDRDGVLEGRQHHTLDMELFGPSSWLEGFYLAALKAGSLMAKEMGDAEHEKEFARLYESGREWTKNNLFNGKYFIQKVDLNDKKTVEHFDALSYWNEETGEIKYQIGEGSSIDQLCAQWHSDILGLGEIFDRGQVRTALSNMVKTNYMPSLRNFTNPWRLFGVNDDAGTLICAYPEDARKPKIPVPYCEETMHGFEYQFAGLLCAEGRYEDGLRAVKAVRDRYDGRWRNPFNEMECGNNYARSMAAYALLPIMSGFRFDLPHGSIGFFPRGQGDFRCLWSLGTGWGSVEFAGSKVKITVTEGVLDLSRVEIPGADKVTSLLIDGKPVSFRAEDGSVVFEKTAVKQAVVLEK